MLTDTSVNQSLNYIRANRRFLNLSAIADEIKVDRATMKRAVDGSRTVRGSIEKIPRGKMPALYGVIAKLKGE